jgi:hypothetical protein
MADDAIHKLAEELYRQDDQSGLQAAGVPYDERRGSDRRTKRWRAGSAREGGNGGAITKAGGRRSRRQGRASPKGTAAAAGP